MKTMILTLALTTLAVTGVAHAQAHASNPSALAEKCAAAWTEVDDAVSHVRLLHAPLDREHRERVVCLLNAINTTQFDKDPKFDAYMASQNVRLVVGVYGAEGLDFFAEQMQTQPERVRNGLTLALLAHGHPAAIRDYFDQRRAKLERHQSWNRDNSAVLGIFTPLIDKGTCAAGVCSEHVAESLAIIRTNIDILDLELAAVEAHQAPTSRSPAVADEAEMIRAGARRLRSSLVRIQHGEGTTGALPPQ